MKTILDLPDELMREAKIRAVHENKKLKHAMAELLRKAWRRTDGDAANCQRRSGCAAEQSPPRKSNRR
jgi:ElaB/YqjD/DUF883 family membrane-anchored ribosome-binding protein